MFSKTDRKDERDGNEPRRGERSAPSIISANLQLVGNLMTDGEMQIDGTVEGNVTGRSVAVGEHAKISGEINADDLVVHGAISGSVRARRVQLSRSARVIGDIAHETLSIEAGAFVEGHLKRLDVAETESTTDTQPQSIERQAKTKKISLITDKSVDERAV